MLFTVCAQPTTPALEPTIRRSPRHKGVLQEKREEDTAANADEEEYESEKKLALATLKVHVQGLKSATDKWTLDQAFLATLEEHYASYSDCEATILEARAKAEAENRGDDALQELKPHPAVLIEWVGDAADFTTWVKTREVKAEAWLRKVTRLRGLIYSKSTRGLYDVEKLKEQIGVLSTDDTGLSREATERLIKSIERRIRMAPDVLKALDAEEPAWTKDEVALHEAYGEHLRLFLTYPAKHPFKKADIDKQIAEAAKKAAEEKKNAEDSEGGESGK